MIKINKQKNNNQRLLQKNKGWNKLIKNISKIIKFKINILSKWNKIKN